MPWFKGTGIYIGNDRTTYVVTDEAGSARMTLLSGATTGKGDKARRVTRQDGLLALVPVRGDAGLEEVVLRDHMEGWWDPTYMEVYSDTEPAHTTERQQPKVAAGKTRRSDSRAAPSPAAVPDVAVDVPARVAEPAAAPAASGDILPITGLEVIHGIFERYEVWRGVGGVLFLRRASRFTTLDSIARFCRGYLEGPHRSLFIRTLRNSEGVRELEEVPFNRFTAPGYVADVQSNDPGWYWRPPHLPQEKICPRSGAVRVPLSKLAGKGTHLAVNSSHASLITYVGSIGSEDNIFPRARSEADTEVLAVMPVGASRSFTVVYICQDGEVAVIRFDVQRDMRSGWEILQSPHPDRPPYLVARDTKGKVRIFKRPD